MLKALTVWQPWASLIMASAKPFEFRGWAPPASMTGQRIVIHAGSRPVKKTEIAELLLKLSGGDRNHTGLVPEIALPLLERWHTAPASLPLASGLGTATLGQARSARAFFGNDSSRDEHFNLAWPLTEIRPFDHPVPARGAQGFWVWPQGATP
jgi:hypothetical protein